ncbi:MAG: extracellular solute-binding protein [Alphaproteobacteria bacterium]|nr:extracellular solute-binding protein [Alphaproteobacteria bacterium]
MTGLRQGRRIGAQIAATVLAASVLGAGLAQASGKESLDALIAAAKKEPKEIDGRLTLAMIPVVKKATELFNKRFGLDKTFKIIEGRDNTFTTKMMATLDIGGRPKLAFYATNGGDMLSFVTGGYAEKIKDWKAVLAEINPRVKSGKVDANAVSPKGYEGYAIAHSNRLKGVGYNKKLISLKDLPRTYAEMASPKYKGQYAIEPWTSHWEALGHSYYPDRLDPFLKIIDAIGANTYVVSRSHQLVPRMALGEIKFMTLNAEVMAAFIADNPGAPLDYYFMDDLVLVETTLVFIPPKSPAPASAALWAMFLSHPDVQALRDAKAPNIMYGEKNSDLEMKARLKGKKVWDWQTDKQAMAYWKWINAKEQKKFRGAIKQAIRQKRKKRRR